jgi:hypothetical protein
LFRIQLKPKDESNAAQLVAEVQRLNILVQSAGARNIAISGKQGAWALYFLGGQDLEFSPLKLINPEASHNQEEDRLAQWVKYFTYRTCGQLCDKASRDQKIHRQKARACCILSPLIWGCFRKENFKVINKLRGINKLTDTMDTSKFKLV